MRSFIVKISPDDELYTYWSTITDSPHICGTKDDVRAYLRRIGEDRDVEERFTRADKDGTSMYPWKDGEGKEHTGFFAWDETHFIVEQRGLVNREDIPELCRCMVNDEPYPHILHPFEDGHMVGW